MNGGMAHFLVEYLQFTDDNPVWMLALYAYVLVYLYTFIHESGHALMASCLGTRVTHFNVGAPGWFRFHWGELHLSFGLYPSGSVTYAYEDDALRWKVMLATLAGPILPVILTLLVFAVSEIQPLTVFLAFIVILQTVINLNPFQRGTDGQKVLMHFNAIRDGHTALNS